MRSLDDASLETPTDTSAPDEERTERTGLMMSSHATRTDRVDRQVRRASSADYVALAARQAEMAQVEEVPSPTWFEGALFVLLSHTGVAAGLSVFMVVGGMCPTVSVFITAWCGGRLTMPAAVAGCGWATLWLAIPSAFFVGRSVWRPLSSGGGTLTALTPAGTMITAEMLSCTKTQIAGFIVFLSIPGLCWTATSAVGVVTELDSSSSATHAFVHAHSTDWLLPSLECTTSETRDMLAAWALYGFVPATIAFVFVVSFAWAAILLACALGQDAIDDLSRDMGLDAAALNDDAWDTKVHDPMVALARSTMPVLDQLGFPVGALVVGWLVTGFCQIPMAVATSNIFSIGLIGFGFVIPTTLMFPIASIGSSCDDLLERLNELLVEGDIGAGNRRVMPLQRYLSNLNRRQGLGVRIFGVVVDKSKLAQIVTVLASLGSTLAVVLFEIGREAWDGVTVPTATCSMAPTLRYELWQAINTMMVHEGGANVTCAYEQLALPAFGLGL
jgi:hypothetical protein